MNVIQIIKQGDLHKQEPFPKPGCGKLAIEEHWL